MTATETVLGRLREDLLTGALAPGDQVVQDTLADRYGTSRVPLREALRIMEAEGQVVHEPNRGYFVTRLSAEDLAEVYRLRALLEAEAIAAAVSRLAPADVEQIARLAEAVETAADLRALADANRAFHFAVFEASGMPRLVRLLQQLWDATDRYRTVYFADPVNRERIHDEHLAFVAALRARDLEAATAVQARHRANSQSAVTAQITSRAAVG